MEPGGAVESAARLLTAPFGATATNALAATIAAAKAGDPLDPVTVIVPGNLTGLALRRQLGARGDGLFNVRFFVLDRLAELLGAGTLAAAGRRPLDDAVKAAFVRQVLAAKPAPLERVASAENTERAVIELLDELQASGPGAIDALRQFSRRGRDLAVIAERFRSLVAHSFYDEHDLAIAAARAIAGGEADLRDVGQVVLHLPHRLGYAQLELVDTLADIDRLWAVVGLTGEADADAEALSLVAHLAPRLEAPVHVGEPVDATTIKVTAPDAVGEVREAMRIVAAELEAGRPLNRVSDRRSRARALRAAPRRGALRRRHPDAWAFASHARPVDLRPHAARGSVARRRPLRSGLGGGLHEQRSVAVQRGGGALGGLGSHGAAGRSRARSRPMD